MTLLLDARAPTIALAQGPHIPKSGTVQIDIRVGRHI